MGKFQSLQSLASDTRSKVLSNLDEWKKFLATASRFNRYTFWDQILIYAQKPDAKACASIDAWNNKLKCYVKRGSKGIALLDDASTSVRYVFDIADVYASKYGRYPELWKYNSTYQSEVINSLQVSYEVNSNSELFPSYIKKLTDVVVAANYNGYLKRMLEHKDDSLLYTLKESDIETIFREVVSSSICYSILSRCDVPEDEFSTLMKLENISFFNNDDLASYLGTTIKELAGPIFHDLSNTIYKINIERINNNDRINISERGRLSSTQSISQKSESTSNRKVWSNEIGISEGRGRDNLQLSYVQGKINTSSFRSSEGSRRNAESVNQSDEGRREHNGRVKGQKSNALGSKNEQYKIEGRGNSDSEYYTQLNLFTLPTFEQQTEVIETNNQINYLNPKNESSFPIEYLDEVIMRDTIHTGGKLRIYDSYSSIESPLPKSRVKDEYYTLDNQLVLYDKQSKKYYSVVTSNEGYDYNIYDESYQLLDGNIYEFISDYDNIRSFALSVFNLDYSYLEEIDYDKFITDLNYQEKAVIKKQEATVDENIHNIDYENNQGIQNELFSRKNAADNYHITDIQLGVGSPKEKFNNNINAIKTLLLIENEKRNATKQEQDILSKYVGWGGLSQAFDPNNSSWNNEYNTLKNLLSDSEYISARSSTLNAHYTSPLIIDSIYKVLDNLGFEHGNILEPSLGIGNFFGVLPDKMKDSSLYGVELDSISGRIAQKLYPNAHITIKGYEETTFNNDFFDVAVGNVPFGSYKVNDFSYKEKFLIHDYFFAKTLDKVRPGGIIAFITSKGTLDKHNSSVRKYISERAELLGAVRLPNDAFSANAGTEVTSDIIFLKKRDHPIVHVDDWVYLGTYSNDISINQYFVDHPSMILGNMELISGPFGMESACVPRNEPLQNMLIDAINKIKGNYTPAFVSASNVELPETIEANPNVRNFSYTIVNDQVFFRQNDEMYKINKSSIAVERIRGLINLRDTTRKIIDMQLSNASDSEIRIVQKELNEAYDRFEAEFGLINSKKNKAAFENDSSYFLLSSLEVIGENGVMLRKADIFTKRTVRMAQTEFSVDTPVEALAISINEKGKIDFEFMQRIINHDITRTEIIDQLRGIIFKNPSTNQYETQDQYLSGNVREKLKEAESNALLYPEYQINVDSLKKVQPKNLEAAEIEVRLGATWIDSKYINEFIQDVLKPPYSYLNNNIINVQYSSVSGLWNISGKNSNSTNVLANMNYGTNRANAYRLIEDALNLKDTKIYDTVTQDGKEIRVLNKKETLLAQQKQELLKERFKEWIFESPERREALCLKYNELFNSIRPREYNGEHLTFPGMNSEINLKPNQKNAVARGIYGGNSLYAHAVGAGKTFAMAATCMKGKQLGISQKSLFVVPKSLVGQWANDFLLLYPGANLLVASSKDFEPANRKKFCSKIATGEYDAIIMSHSQFDKIPLSKERQKKYISKQIYEITSELDAAKNKKGERYTVKQMELTRKSLQSKLDKLNSMVSKDDVVTFEELGIDRLFVDEAHGYKNLFLYTKMSNVAGISQTNSEKSNDMFNKCRYLNELTNNKGVIFATGTPVSNSMTELYTMMRYLQFDTLKKMGLTQFDSWASTFGETVTSMELTVEGNSYRARTRFSKFYNLPELMNTFKEVADIQTSDMLNLPVPETEYITDVQKPSDIQREILKSISERADHIRSGNVEPSEDNMLKITSDGRKLALDQRLINPLLEDNPNSKVNSCVKNVCKIWNETAQNRSTQIIFCDLSTPNKKEFNVYDDIKNKLILNGVPEKEIEFIHDADTEAKKLELFAKVRKGNVRVLLGSTQKLGTGVNVQTKLIAVHHIDPPWRPSDIEQREGRIIRQGNENIKVLIYRYVTEGTFDAYSWQMLENKQKFIGQVMTSKSAIRSCGDIDESILSYAEVKALATGNPLIKEKMDLDMQVSKLKLLKSNYINQKYRLQDNINKILPTKIKELESKIAGYTKDMDLVKAYKDKEFEITLDGIVYTDKKEAGTKLLDMCRISKIENLNYIGKFKEFNLGLSFDAWYNHFKLSISKNMTYSIVMSEDPFGNLTKLSNVLSGIEKLYLQHVQLLDEAKNQLFTSLEEIEKPFTYDKELNEKTCRLNELNSLLSMEEKVTVNEQSDFVVDHKFIEDDLKKNHMKPTNSLIKNISELNMKMRKTIGIREIKSMMQDRNKLESTNADLVLKIYKESMQQVLER